MFGKMGDMAGMLKKAYEMKKEMAKIKEELENTELKGVFGSSVEVICTGNYKIKSIKIAPEAIRADEAKKLEEMLTIAVNNAIEEAQKLSGTKMAALTGGLNIPGLF